MPVALLLLSYRCNVIINVMWWLFLTVLRWSALCDCGIF